MSINFNARKPHWSEPESLWGTRHHYIQARDIEEDIVEYTEEGNTPEEIASELGVSASSVRRVLEDACQKEPN